MEETQVKVEPEKIIWKNHLTGEEYSNSLDISYYQNFLKDEKYSNLLLGNFNKDGNYSIDVEILKELVAVNKYITEVVDGTYLLTAKTASGSDFDLNFLLKIKKQDDERKIAILILLEKFVSGDNLHSTTLNTVVARYRDEDDIYFLSKVAKAFHIFDKRNEDGREKENEEILKNILALKKSMLLLKKKLAENDEYLSQYYIDSILALLKANPGQFSEYVLRKYAIALENNKANFGKANYYKLLRLELDKILNSAKKSCDNPEILKAIETQRKAFIDAYNKFEDNIKNPPVIAPQAKKASPAKAKSAGSASKKAGAKKAGKKAGGKKASPAKKKPQQYFPPKKENKEQFITITLQDKSEKKPSKKETLAGDLINEIFKSYESSNIRENTMDNNMANDVDSFLTGNTAQKEQANQNTSYKRQQDIEFNFN